MKFSAGISPRRITFAHCLIYLGLAIFLFQSCTEWTEEQKKRQSLPDFQFEKLMGGTLQRSDLPEGKPATIFYFDPDCSHCKTAIASLAMHIDAFGENTLVILSPADRGHVIPALSEKGLFDRKGVLVGLCTPQQFLDTFGTTETPTTLFYGGDFDLKMAYKGPMEPQGVLDGLAATKE